MIKIIKMYFWAAYDYVGKEDLDILIDIAIFKDNEAQPGKNVIHCYVCLRITYENYSTCILRYKNTRVTLN